MAFDGIVTTAIASELQQLVGARIDKVYQPDKNTILLGCYVNRTNYLLTICTDANNYRIHLTTHPKPNPKVAPNFCMVLRKHLLGLSIKNITTNHLERLVVIDFEGFDDVDDVITKRLIIELMGKHCNIILLDDQNIILDSLRHIHQENSDRTIIPHTKYSFPSTTKYNFLTCPDFQDFYKKVADSSIDSVFNGISKSFLDASLLFLGIKVRNETTLKQLYHYLHEIIDRIDDNRLDFQPLDGKKKDYVLVKSESTSPFHLNYFLDDFYTEKEASEKFKTYRDSILRMILEQLKKYKKRLLHIDEKLQSCNDKEKYQLYGELITTNLYQIKNENQKELILDNYYTNQKIVIPLDDKYPPSINAKQFFKKYHKLKNTLTIVSMQKEETLKELTYIESIVYELENCSTVEEVSEIFQEISEHVIFKEKAKFDKKRTKTKKSSFTKNKTVSFNPLKYTIDEYTLLVGRNNKENDYLTFKYAKKTDLWLHTKDIHGSHAILLSSSKTSPNSTILTRCAQIVAYHSKAKNSSHVPVDICGVNYVKKPNGAKPGMVIYSHQKTLWVEPKQP